MFGPPGAGKGTQAGMLAEWLSVPHISTGEVLRKEISESTELGERAKSYVESGALVPDDLLISMVKERLTSAGSAGWILDGFPRTIAQARFLGPALVEINQPLSAVIFLDVPRQTAVSRLLHRSQIEGRKDDTEATVRKRLDVYESQTLPVLEFYDSEGKLVKIDGDRQLEEVASDLKECLQSRLSL